MSKREFTLTNRIVPSLLFLLSGITGRANVESDMCFYAGQLEKAAMENSDSPVLLADSLAATTIAEHGIRPLHYAALYGHCPSIQYLLDLGALPAASANDGVRALHLAAYSGSSEAIRMLVQAGDSVSSAGTFWTSPIHIAADLGHANVLREMLRLSDGRLTSGPFGWLPVHGAALRGDVESCKALVGSPEFAKRTEGGRNAAHYAALGGHTTLLSWLEEQGVDFEARDVFGRLPRDYLQSIDADRIGGPNDLDDQAQVLLNVYLEDRRRDGGRTNKLILWDDGIVVFRPEPTTSHDVAKDVWIARVDHGEASSLMNEMEALGFYRLSCGQVVEFHAAEVLIMALRDGRKTAWRYKDHDRMNCHASPEEYFHDACMGLSGLLIDAFKKRNGILLEHLYPSMEFRNTGW